MCCDRVEPATLVERRTLLRNARLRVPHRPSATILTTAATTTAVSFSAPITNALDTATIAAAATSHASVPILPTASGASSSHHPHPHRQSAKRRPRPRRRAIPQRASHAHLRWQPYYARWRSDLVDGGKYRLRQPSRQPHWRCARCCKERHRDADGGDVYVLCMREGDAAVMRHAHVTASVVYRSPSQPPPSSPPPLSPPSFHVIRHMWPLILGSVGCILLARFKV